MANFNNKKNLNKLFEGNWYRRRDSRPGQRQTLLMVVFVDAPPEASSGLASARSNR